MQLYIPEIGAKLALKEPWTFPLSYQLENVKLFESKLGKHVCLPYEGCKSKAPYGLASLDDCSNHDNPIYDHEDPRCSAFLKELNRGCLNLRMTGNRCGGLVPCIDVTFPRDTILTVTRICIRPIDMRRAKRPASISFQAREPKSANTVRFAANLRDIVGIDVVELADSQNTGRFKRIASFPAPCGNCAARKRA